MLSENDFVKSTLINGDREFCKAFLFEVAISWAKEGQRVYYFTSKQFQHMPLTFHDCSEPTADALKLIAFMYVSNYEELANQLVRLHTFQRVPMILLVDDLDVFTGHTKITGCPREVHVARCCALLLNTALTCSKVLGKPVHLCSVNFDGNEYKNIYCRYFDNCWNVTTQSGDNSSNEVKKVWMNHVDGRQAFEFCRLDDAVLVLRKVFVKEEHELQ